MHVHATLNVASHDLRSECGAVEGVEWSVFQRAVRRKPEEIRFVHFCRVTTVVSSTIAALIMLLRLGGGYCFFLLVYCAGQGVRRVFVARAGQGREVRVRATDFLGTCIIDPPLKASRTRGSIKNDSWLVSELIPAILGYYTAVPA